MITIESPNAMDVLDFQADQVRCPSDSVGVLRRVEFIGCCLFTPMNMGETGVGKMYQAFFN
jgi:hypothetical protein